MTGLPVTTPVAPSSLLRAFLVSLRPWEWSKNVVVFTGVVFAHRFHDCEAWWRTLLAFAAFCGLSSLIYVVNDLCDREQDRHHPVKRLRPIAAGQLSRRAIGTGLAVLVPLIVVSVAPMGLPFVAWAGIYLALNAAYSLGLKRIVFLDIFCVAAGFLVRVVAGCAAINVPVSGYALTCVFSLALLLGAGKRRAELMTHGDNSVRHRHVFDHYTPRMLDVTLAVVVLATVVSYYMFVTGYQGLDFLRSQFVPVFFRSEPEPPRPHPPAMAWTLIFVVAGICRYLWLLYRCGEAEEPARLVWRDGLMLLTCAGWVITTVVVLWIS